MTDHPFTQLTAYFDRELDALQKQAVQAHLLLCSQCQSELRQWQSLRQLFQSMAPPAVAEDASGFWRKLAPQLPQPRPLLGLAWTWGLFMVLGSVLLQTIMTVLLVLGVANLAGLPWMAWLPGPGLHLRETLLHDIGQSPLGALLGAPLLSRFIWLVILLPLLLILMLSVGMALSFLGWVFASSRRRRLSGRQSASPLTLTDPV